MKRVTPQQVELRDLRLADGYSGFCRLIGRVRNASPNFRLQSVELRITLRDCVAGGESETVGDTTVDIYVDVPPGQTRGIDSSVYFSGLPPLKGSPAWSYALVEAGAK